MYNQNRTFSVKAKVPWGAVSNNYKAFERHFKERIEHTFDSKVVICIRPFRSSSMCRFTLMFDDWQTFPDKKLEILKEAIKKTILDLIGYKDDKVLKN